MNEIFNTGDGRKLVLFDSQNSLFMSAFSRDYASRPTLLSNDYSKELSACILGNKLYYAYIASNNHIKIKSIDDNRTKWEFDENADNLFLTTYDDIFVLFYTNEDSNIAEKININCHILIGETNMSNSALLMHIYENTIMPRPYTNYCINNHIEHQLNETLLQQKKEYLFSITAELEEKYTKKENQIKTHYEEQLAAKENEIKQDFQAQIAAKEAAVKKLCENQATAREKSIRRNYENKIKELNATISSIKLQYEQLMNTASRYREEANKWHSLYHSKSRRNQSGNENH